MRLEENRDSVQQTKHPQRDFIAITNFQIIGHYIAVGDIFDLTEQ